PGPGTRDAQSRRGKPAVRQDPVLLPGETVPAPPRADAPRRGKPGVLLYEPLRGAADPRISDAGPDDPRHAGNAGTRLPGPGHAAEADLSRARVQRSRRDGRREEEGLHPAVGALTASWSL